MSFEFSLAQLLLIAAVGVIAGVINGSVGGGSLLTYPLLVAIGISPVYAAATNTTGLSSGNLAAVIPHYRAKALNFGLWRQHAFATASGAVIGGSLLIALPQKVFEFLVPILLVVASITMVFKPKVHSNTHAKKSQTLAALVGSGVYSGYFGPGQGVIAMAVLMRDGRLSMHHMIVIKNFVLSASNVVVAILFIFTGHVLWLAAVTLFVSASVGGLLGAFVSERINPTALRWAVAGVGLLSAGWFIQTR